MRGPLTNPTILLTLAGVLWYGFLNIGYSSFYEPLGIRPSDVGLSYANILASSIGTVIILGVFFALLFPVSVSLVIIFLITSRFRFFQSENRYLAVTLMLNLLLAVSVAGYALVGAAVDRSKDVRQGEAVTPPDLEPLPFGGLSIFAYPITVSAVGEDMKADGIRALRMRKSADPPLLYLGQNGGIVVLYDSSSQQAIYVPAGSIVLKTYNCVTLPANAPPCL